MNEAHENGNHTHCLPGKCDHATPADGISPARTLLARLVEAALNDAKRSHHSPHLMDTTDEAARFLKASGGKVETRTTVTP